MKKFNFNQFFLNSILEMKTKGLARDLKLIKRIDPIRIKYKGKTLINLSSNDYLGLSQNKIIKNYTKKIIDNYGIGSGSSRLISGNFDFHEKVEDLLAKKKKSESTIIFSTGYLANYSVLSSILDSKIFKKDPIVFSDKLNHQCIYEGCKNNNIKFLRFHHNDMNHLELLLKKNLLKNNPKFILSESIFSMDGDFAKIKDLIYLKKKYGTFLFLDEAHSTGVYGKNGFGLSTEFSNEIDCVTGTFSKAFGSFGAYVSCSLKLKNFLINKCSSFIYSTSLPFSLLASIYSAIKIIPKLKKERKKLIKNASFLRNYLIDNNFNINNSQSHIIPIIIGDIKKTMKISKNLEKKGFYVVPIRPPTVPSNSSRIRISLSSFHSKDDIKRFLKIFKKEFKK
tara:strand:- start:6971 stop:8155 length:1185 start_codon:yes stop_codon:yes gene_type:complete